MQRTNRKDSELLQLFLFCLVNSLVKSCFYSVFRYHILWWNKAVYKRRRNTARACARDSRRGAHVEKRLQRFEVDGDFFLAHSVRARLASATFVAHRASSASAAGACGTLHIDATQRSAGAPSQQHARLRLAHPYIGLCGEIAIDNLSSG